MISQDCNELTEQLSLLPDHFYNGIF